MEKSVFAVAGFIASFVLEIPTVKERFDKLTKEQKRFVLIAASVVLAVIYKAFIAPDGELGIDGVYEVAMQFLDVITSATVAYGSNQMAYAIFTSREA